jgi:glycosyltransferase involved in cell wall biosynthesis
MARIPSMSGRYLSVGGFGMAGVWRPHNGERYSEPRSRIAKHPSRMNKKQLGIKPLASVALATFNGSRFLRQQLDSLIAQTYQNIEIVVSDDQSSDGTVDILAQYSACHSNIRWSTNPDPQGYAKNFERAIRSCNGEIIFLCDQDDIWLPQKVELHIAAYSDPEIAWVYNRVLLIDENNNKIGTLEDTAPEYYQRRSITQAAWGSCILGCATSYRATAIMSALPIGRYARAHDSWIQLMVHSEGYSFLDSQLQLYRLHGSNSAGWNNNTSEEQNIKMRDGYIDLLKELAMNQNIRRTKRSFFLFLYLKKILKRTLSFGELRATTKGRR